MKKARLYGCGIIYAEELTPDEIKALIKRSKKSKFKPDRAFLNSAIDEYLKNGGKITKIEPNLDAQCKVNFRGDIDEFLEVKT